MSDSNGSFPSHPIDFGDNDNGPADNSADESEEEFLYPGANESLSHEVDVPATIATVSQSGPSPAQLEALYAAASSGDLSLLKRLFRSALESGDVEEFALANDASSRTGLTALHASASRGYLDIVQWCRFIFTCSNIRPLTLRVFSGRTVRCHPRFGRQRRRG